jgi:dihydroorotase
MPEEVDLLVAGGTLLDPATGREERADIAVCDGRIAAIAPSLPREGARQVIDARGGYVTAGLIDLHLHAYGGVSPYGFDADPVCLASGVTAAVDAGSAGPVNFLGFKRFIAASSRARLLALVSLAQHGVLRSPGELEDLRCADPEGAAAAVRENPDVAVGIKVRLHRGAAGENARPALRLALRAGEASRSPVMVHIGDTAISLEEIVESLRPGDIVTHCYTPKRPSVIDEAGRLRPAVRRAKERGVLFDVGHAGGHFDFDLVRRAMGEGLLPDTISTDLHGRLPPGHPVVDLPTTLSKFLALGMGFSEVVAACTSRAARAIGWQDRLGAVAVGREADLAVLEIVEGPAKLRDSLGNERVAERRIVPRWTIRARRLFGPAPDRLGSPR